MMYVIKIYIKEGNDRQAALRMLGSVIDDDFYA